ncbi:MAG: magnesium/cobalt transporter CorA [Candidatus Bipolaricaulota bacterium]
MKSYFYSGKSGLTRDKGLEELIEKKEREEGSFWIDIGEEDFSPETVKKIGNKLELHPLTVDNVLTRENRPIVELFDDYLFVLASSLGGAFELGRLETRQLSIVLGDNYVATFHRKEIDAIERAMKGLEANSSGYFGQGVDYLVYKILDFVTEDHFPVLDRIEEEVDRIEDEVLENPSEEVLGEISNLRSDLIEIQRSTGPQREMAAKLARAETPLIQEKTRIYFRDIQDELARLSDLRTNYRDMVSGARDMYMTVISNRMNEIMQTLTIVATIFIPLTFIAGIYGMNFEIMPELGWDWGYYGALGIMGGAAGGMLYYFKRKGWF